MLTRRPSCSAGYFFAHFFVSLSTCSASVLLVVSWPLKAVMIAAAAQFARLRRCRGACSRTSFTASSSVILIDFVISINWYLALCYIGIIMTPSEVKATEKLENLKKKFNSFGSRMRALREDLGVTQAELATQLGFTSHNVVSRFEKGLRQPNAETLLRLAALGDINLHWLITGEFTPDSEKLREDCLALLIDCNTYMSKYEEKVKDERGKLINEFHRLQAEKSGHKGGNKDERIKYLEIELIPQKDRELAEIAKARKSACERYYGPPKKSEEI